MLNKILPSTRLIVYAVLFLLAITTLCLKIWAVGGSPVDFSLALVVAGLPIVGGDRHEIVV